MRTTIDSGGRVVIPKSMREHLGLASGAVVDVEERDGRIEIAAAEAAMSLVEINGVLVAKGTDELPPLTDDIVRDTIDRTRR